MTKNGKVLGIRVVPSQRFRRFVGARFPNRSKTCKACGDNPTIKTMEDSAVFAAKHGLAVERSVPEMEEVPTATCQVIARVVLG